MTENIVDEHVNITLNNKGKIQEYAFGTQLFTWFLVFGFCFVLAQMISGALIVAYYQSIDMHKIVADVYHLNALRFAQLLATIISFLLPAFIFSKLKSNTILSYSAANIGFNPVFFIIVPMLIYTIYPSINFLFFVNKWIGIGNVNQSSQTEYKMLVDALLKDDSVVVLMFNLLIIAIVPAIAEEWIFRGSLQRFLSEKISIHIAIVFSAILFSLIHFEFSGFLPRIALGIFLGYLFYYSGSLWLCIFAHAVNNGTQVVLMYLNNKDIYRTDVDNPTMPAMWEIAVYSIAFIGLWSIFLHFAQQRKSSTFVK
ncbi:MAG TPA: type II CAAX endopeptidase family protein [Chitinophagales bacterium]|nr:type II CAAX endopeptidase family protein [Chitinophagales bacterium]